MDHTHKPLVLVQHHGHSHVQAELHRPEEKKRLIWTVILTGSMMVVEVVAGWLTNSLALISDAQHMFTHFFALGVSLFALLYAKRECSPEKSFGLYRAEVLAALFNGITLLLITAYIFYLAIGRIFQPEPIAEIQMLIVAIGGLLVNLGSAVILWPVGKKDLNVRSAFLHMLADTASSGGIIVGALLIILTGWYVIDAIVSLLIGLVILYWSFGLLRDSITVLMEATPKHIRIEEVKALIRANLPQVRQIHDLHVWEITSQMYSMTAHVVVQDMAVCETEDLRDRICHLMEHNFGVNHCVLQFETRE
jgi:cobalt-zinc-cadmium efflux system protein